jgi:hypothetical protein
MKRLVHFIKRIFGPSQRRGIAETFCAHCHRATLVWRDGNYACTHCAETEAK